MTGRLTLASAFVVLILAGTSGAQTRTVGDYSAQAYTARAQAVIIRSPQTSRPSMKTRSSTRPVYIPRQADIYQGYPQVNIQ
jgi:hypothetical protein